jgi:hypothetical protein
MIFLSLFDLFKNFFVPAKPDFMRVSRPTEKLFQKNFKKGVDTYHEPMILCDRQGHEPMT